MVSRRRTGHERYETDSSTDGSVGPNEATTERTFAIVSALISDCRLSRCNISLAAGCGPSQS